jgi:hypothetical protein
MHRLYLRSEVLIESLEVLALVATLLVFGVNGLLKASRNMRECSCNCRDVFQKFFDGGIAEPPRSVLT